MVQGKYSFLKKKLINPAVVYHVESVETLTALLEIMKNINGIKRIKMFLLLALAVGLVWPLHIGFASAGANIILNGRGQISDQVLAEFAGYPIKVVVISGDI